MRHIKIILAIIFVLGFPVGVQAKYKSTPEAAGKLALNPQALGNIALVIRGDKEKEITVVYHQFKKGIWGAAIGAGVGGMVGAAVGGAIATGGVSKAAHEDNIMQNQLNYSLEGWRYDQLFYDALNQVLSPDYKNRLVKSILYNPEGWLFEKADMGYYEEASRGYGKDETIYNYSPLVAEGVQTVLEFTLTGWIAPKSMMTKNVLSHLTVRLNVIDLSQNKLLRTTFVHQAAWKFSGKFEKLLENQGQQTREGFIFLTEETSQKIAQKL